IDFNDPLYLHPSDTPGINLVTEQLIGTENYGVWSRAMLIALTAKNKLGFIDGTCEKPDTTSPKLHQWERCNAFVLSWIMNTVSREIFNGSLTVSAYYSKLRQLWDEYDSLVTLPRCGCPTSRAYVEHDQQQKLLQFLMGLNDSYGDIRSQILMMNPLPTIGQAYSLISQEESHRGILSVHATITDTPAAFYSSSNKIK
ncbi:UBN2_3 domain-containing protein, partial [Cephalotus follicularis]